MERRHFVRVMALVIVGHPDRAFVGDGAVFVLRSTGEGRSQEVIGLCELCMRALVLAPVSAHPWFAVGSVRWRCLAARHEVKVARGTP